MEIECDLCAVPHQLKRRKKYSIPWTGNRNKHCVRNNCGHGLGYLLEHGRFLIDHWKGLSSTGLWDAGHSSHHAEGTSGVQADFLACSETFGAEANLLACWETFGAQAAFSPCRVNPGMQPDFLTCQGTSGAEADLLACWGTSRAQAVLSAAFYAFQVAPQLSHMAQEGLHATAAESTKQHDVHKTIQD